MKIAVTGGTGFVGRELVKCLLNDGHPVRLLTREKREDDKKRRLTYFRGDLISHWSELVPLFDDIEVVFHCAGELGRPELMEALHVEGTENLLKAAKGWIGRFVHLSSVGVYGPQRNGIVTESTQLNPIGIYEKTKTKADLIVLDAIAKNCIKGTILRPSNIFGPTMKNQSVFQLIRMIKQRKFFFIGQPGAIANYIHVNDVVDALIKCAKSTIAEGQVYNLSDYMKLEDWVQLIASELGTKEISLRLPEKTVRFIVAFCERFVSFPLTSSRVDALTIRAKYSIAKIEKELGYTHKIGMAEGSKEMINAYLKTSDF